MRGGKRNGQDDACEGRGDGKRLRVFQHLGLISDVQVRGGRREDGACSLRGGEAQPAGCHLLRRGIFVHVSVLYNTQIPV